MRQTRQSTASASTQQAFTLTSQPEPIDDMSPAAGYDMPIPPGSYMPPATHPSPTLTSAHRRVRTQEAAPIDARSKPQWPRAY